MPSVFGRVILKWRYYDIWIQSYVCMRLSGGGIVLYLLISSAKAMSTVASTASFDKNPQSKERGITLDLGFSSFSIPIPAHLREADSGSSVSSPYESVQFTLVDCPGHASLIRTIIGGTHMLFVQCVRKILTKH